MNCDRLQVPVHSRTALIWMCQAWLEMNGMKEINTSLQDTAQSRLFVCFSHAYFCVALKALKPCFPIQLLTISHEITHEQNTFLQKGRRLRGFHCRDFVFYFLTRLSPGLNRL